MSRRQLRSNIDLLISQIMIEEQNERSAIFVQINKANGWTAELPEGNRTRQPGDWKTDLHLDVHTPEGEYIGVTWEPGAVQVCSDEEAEPHFEVTVDLAMHDTNHAAIMDALCSVYAKMKQATVEEVMELLKPVHT